MNRILRDITKLKILKEIDIKEWNLCLIGLPESIDNLKNLQILSIKNVIRIFPDTLGNLKNLEEFNLANL